MKFTILQDEADKTNYAERAAGFFTASGVKTKEQLESRFCALMTSFAMSEGGCFDENTITLNMTAASRIAAEKRKR